jgi:aspartyl-tRNA(Asn)/glutamyl-tRNA(Gln) amidotransferase subunit B
MRSKEEANDYRYFPDPDLLPVVIEESFLEAVKATLPELPDEKKRRYMETLSLNAYDAGVLTASRDVAEYFEAVFEIAGGESKLSANWVSGELMGALNKNGLSLSDSPVSAAMLGGMIKRIADNTISGKIAKEVFEAMWNGEGDADTVIEAKGLKQITDSSAIEPIIDEIIANNPGQLEQYRAGKDKLFGFFVGQVMQATKGKANPQQVNELLQQKLKA